MVCWQPATCFEWSVLMQPCGLARIYLLQMFLGTLSTCKNVIMVQQHRGRISGLEGTLKSHGSFNILYKLFKVHWLSGVRPGPVW